MKSSSNLFNIVTSGEPTSLGSINAFLCSLCLYFFPSFTLPPGASVFVGKQARKRKKEAHTPTDKKNKPNT